MRSRTSGSALAAVALAALVTCSGLDNIEVEATGTTVVPEASILDEVLGQLSFAGFDSFDISQSQEFRNQGYSKDQVDSVRLERFSLTVRDPDDGNFDFLDRIAFTVTAEGLPPVEIASLDPVPVGASRIELDVVAGVELQPYVLAPSLTIETTASGRRPAVETTVDASVVFDIDVNVSGGCE